MLKAVGRSRPVHQTAGLLASGYLRLVQATNRFVQEPAGFLNDVAADLPAIVAMWHGQHFMVHYAWPRAQRSRPWCPATATPRSTP